MVTREAIHSNRNMVAILHNRNMGAVTLNILRVLVMATDNPVQAMVATLLAAVMGDTDDPHLARVAWAREEQLPWVWVVGFSVVCSSLMQLTMGNKTPIKTAMPMVPGATILAAAIFSRLESRMVAHQVFAASGYRYLWIVKNDGWCDCIQI